MSITDKRVEAPTSKDDQFAAQETRLRRAVLLQPEIQERFAQLYELRPGGHVSIWPPQDGLAYWLAIADLERELEGTLSQAEIDAEAERWPRRAREIASGTLCVGVGFETGREGRGRHRGPEVIGLVARSLALRASGLRPSAADEAAADEVNQGLPPRYRTATAERVAIYRLRLRRDRRTR